MTRTTRQLFTFLTTLTLATAAGATDYRKVWVQDFEDENTYTNQISVGAVDSTVFGLTSSFDKQYGGVSQGVRTTYDGDTSYFYEIYFPQRDKASTFTSSVLFTMPGVATSATDYHVEFDYLMDPVTTGTSAGMVIHGSKGVLATIYAPAGASSNESTAYVYKGDSKDDQLATFKTCTRGNNPETVSSKYWLHVTVVGTSTTGVHLTVARADGTEVVPNAELSSDFDVVDKLCMCLVTGNRWTWYMALDDVSVWTPATKATYVWTGAEDSYWKNPGNWTVNNEIPVDVPTAIDDVSIPADKGTVVVDTNKMAYASITVGDNSKIGILTTGITTSATISVPTGVSAEKVTVMGPYETTVSEGVVTATRIPGSFHWSGAVSTDCSVPANWLVGGYNPGVIPTMADEVIFDSAAVNKTIDNTYCSSGDFFASNMVFNTDMTLFTRSDKTRNWKFYDFGGTGKVTLHYARLMPFFFTIQNATGTTTPDMVISNDFEVEEGTDNYFYTGSKSNDDYIYVEYSGALSGRGTLTLTASDGRRRGGNWLSGNNVNFEGTVKLVDNNGYHRTYHHFSKAQAVGSKMSVYLSYSGAQHYDGIFPFQKKSVTYEIGALNGSVEYYTEGNGGAATLKVGARDEDCSVSGDWLQGRTALNKVQSANLTLNWCATNATMNWAAQKFNNMYITGGGTLYIVSSNDLPWTSLSFTEKGGTLKTGYDLVVDAENEAVTNVVPVDPSALIKSSAVAITFDDQGTNRTWATALNSNNTNGFTKAGSGTLTLASTTAVSPTLGYTGYTRVEAGKLAIAEGTHYKWDITSRVTLDNAIDGATPTAFGIGTVDTVWTYGTDSFEGTSRTVDLTNLTGVDVSSYAETVTKGTTIPLITAKAYTGKTKGELEALPITWAENQKPDNADFVVKIVGKQLVVTCDRPPLYIHVR